MATAREAEAPRLPAEIRAIQEKKFAALLRHVLRTNPFYRAKYDGLNMSADGPVGLSDRERLPLVTRDEILDDQRRHSPFGTNLTFRMSEYTRLLVATAERGAEICWLDTPQSWRWWIDCWERVLRAAELGSSDRVLVTSREPAGAIALPALEAGQRVGALMMPVPALDPARRAAFVLEHGITVLIADPAEAIEIGEAIAAAGRDPAQAGVRALFHPGPAPCNGDELRHRVRALWNATVLDQVGDAALGPWGWGCGVCGKVHVNEAEFVAEVVDPSNGSPSATAEDGGQHGELVLTNLGRVGSPLIRFRTGLRVALSRSVCTASRGTAVVSAEAA